MRLKDKLILGITSAALLISAQVFAQAEPPAIWKRHPDYIAVAASPTTMTFDHPTQLSAVKIARALSQITVKGSSYNPDDSLWADDNNNVQRLFTDKEIDLLASKMSEGFKSLNKDQIILFSISDYHPTIIGRKLLSISGSAFVTTGHLNLLLGDVHVDLQAKQARSGITGTYGRIKNNLSNGDLAQPAARDWELLAFTGAETIQGRKDWISIDLTTEFEYQSYQHKTTQTEEKYLTEKQREASNSNLEARLEKLEAAYQQESSSGKNIQERLKTLRGLFENGVLPESVYLEKVKAIMTEL